MASKFEKMIEEIGNMSVLDLADFVKALETKFGVSAAMPMMAAAAAPAAEAAPKAEEKTEYKVTLSAAGDKKIDVIKALRKVTTLGLAEAKAAVENAPTVIGEAVAKADAQNMKKELEAAGAKVELA
ncbi:50S ribosomal protein L7/L12 [Candidatus Dependentiae bacterium]|nr:50S ribosomal protein L7/L12 [Candidatus Dependentiae bacterium]